MSWRHGRERSDGQGHLRSGTEARRLRCDDQRDAGRDLRHAEGLPPLRELRTRGRRRSARAQVLTLARGPQAAFVFLLSLIACQGAILWLDNVHIVTSNGLYKAIQAEPWIAAPGTARLDPSNYLYFPLYGLLCRILDFVGIWRGVPWKQLAVLNGLFAAIGTACVYLFVRELTGKTFAAILGALFHLGCGFVLLLAVISEDIMPGYVLVLASMLLAGLWFAAPTWRRIAVVGALFTLGWLMEWRLLFPTLPAFVLALALAHGTAKQKAAWIGTLALSILVVSGATQLLWDGHNGAVGLHDMLWTGKGVASGWAGVAWDKAWQMLSGLGNYFLLMGGFVDPASARRAALPLIMSVALQTAILLACLAIAWPRRHEPRIRATGTVFLGTFAAGFVFNLYSQPQDPQMQLNVMPWLTVAWALVIATALERGRAKAALVALSLAPLVFNLTQLSRERGGDAQSLRALATIERNLPTPTTVFLYWGFEPITVWQYALWSRTWDWDGSATVAPAPSDNPRFKWIAVTAGAIRHPQWSAEQHAATLKRDIELALDRGYRVAVSDFWTWSVAELAAHLGGLAASDRAPAIHAMLHNSYDVRPLFTVDGVGRYYELRRR
jgi:hypothetical protein